MLKVEWWGKLVFVYVSTVCAIKMLMVTFISKSIYIYNSFYIYIYLRYKRENKKDTHEEGKEERCKRTEQLMTRLLSTHGSEHRRLIPRAGLGGRVPGVLVHFASLYGLVIIHVGDEGRALVPTMVLVL